MRCWRNLRIARRISITTTSTTNTTLTTTLMTTLLPSPLLPTTLSPCLLIAWVPTPLLWWAKLLWWLTLTAITTKVRLWLTKITKDTTLLRPTKVHCWTTPYHCTNSPPVNMIEGIHGWVCWQPICSTGAKFDIIACSPPKVVPSYSQRIK